MLAVGLISCHYVRCCHGNAPSLLLLLLLLLLGITSKRRQLLSKSAEHAQQLYQLRMPAVVAAAERERESGRQVLETSLLSDGRHQSRL